MNQRDTKTLEGLEGVEQICEIRKSVVHNAVEQGKGFLIVV
jgi:hypothetical protein